MLLSIKQGNTNPIVLLATGIVVSLYLPIIFSNVIIICTTLLGLLDFWRDNKQSSFVDFYDFKLSAPILLFVFCAISLFFSQNLFTGLKALETRSPLILLPLGLFSLGKLKEEQLNRIVIYFILASVAISLYSLGMAMTNFLNTSSNTEDMQSPFAYHSLAAPLNFHAGYLSMMTSCGALFTLCKIKFDFGWNTVLRIVAFGILSGFTLLLSTFSVSIGFFAGVIFCLFKKRDELKPVVLGLFFLVFVSIAVPASKYLEIKLRGISFEMDTKGNVEGNRFTPISGRLAKWGSSIELIVDHPFGVGVGDAQKVLNGYYLKNGLEYGYVESFDPHNLFLSYAISCGVAAGFLILLLIIVAWRDFVRFKMLEGQLFLIVFSAFSLTESTLSRNKGLVFFLFFLLIFRGYTEIRRKNNII